MSKKLPTRQEDYSAWYNELVKRAGLAENSAVRGCMVIKPYGYAIWEKMQRTLDDMFKRTGHENAYFPIFIPKSLFEAEEKNAEGFAKECAVVTHYRLQTDPDRPGKLRVDPAAKLEEELVVRPTSEAIIWSTYKNWVQSYRDLPLLINQWANVVRWEMRTRLFLRTAEFLWQEGHTAHATAAEAVAETRQMLDVYAEFAEEHLALPVVKGVKTPAERFAGAEDTYCIEALMQDGKALQAGTSHFLGQNFAKAFDVQFQTKDGGREYVWGTSWGVSTRLMGALVMAHSDDEGLVLPPKLAPIQVVIIPIYKTGELDALLDRIRPIQQGLVERGILVKVDARDTERPGFKFAEWELKGVPVRLAIGARDLDAGTVEAARRDTREKLQLPLADVVASVEQLLTDIQNNLYQRAKDYRTAHTTHVETYDEFKQTLDATGGFVVAHYDGTAETEERIKEDTKATVRCLPLHEADEAGTCMVTGQPSARRAWFARAY